MLRLKRVELQGFKSFCDRTEMRFNGSGLTAVVGPNGCGKSNLSDAISWVLGEQSAKSLRGSRMMDVIFAGTNARKPLGLASVTMTLADPGGSVPAEAQPGSNGHSPKTPAEITITRRLFRSGESEYLIDGRAARLRDIQDLFMGTGLGPESYAIIEQGRIGQILSSKPQDRRAIIEEAAGIGKFKTRRRLAEAKLEGARQNLNRVFDILEEVGRQANSLKRQASKARRYQELQAELVVELRRTLAGRLRKLEREAAQAALDLNLANAEYQRLATQVDGSEQELTRTREETYRVEAELTEARAKLAELRVEAERIRGRLHSQAAQIGGIDERLTQGEADARQAHGRLSELSREAESHARSLAELEDVSQKAKDTLNQKTGEKEAAQADLRDAELGIERGRQAVLRLLGEAAALKNEQAQIDEYLASVARDAARSEREQAASSEELERLRANRAQAAQRLFDEKANLESVTEERARLDQGIGEKRGSLGLARARLEELRSEVSSLRARRQSLAEILSHRAYTTESVKRFFTALKGETLQEVAPLGVLADFVEVDPAYERAAEEFLHDELEFIVVRDWRQADQGIELMRKDLDGRATFLVHPEPDASIASAISEPPLGPETGIVTRLSSVLRLTNGLTHAPAQLLPRLARCMIAENRQAAQRLALEHPDFYFLLPDGVCYHGYAVSGGKKSGSGPLALKRELRELTALVGVRDKELAGAGALVEALEEEISRLSDELEKLRAAQQTQEKNVLALEHETRKTEEEISRAEARLSVARAEFGHLLSERTQAVKQRELNQRGLEEKEQARLAAERELEDVRAHLGRLQDNVARLTEEHSALRVALAEREERRRSESSAQARMETQRDETSERHRELIAEIDRLGLERARLLADNIELDRRAAALTVDAVELEKGIETLEAQETQLRESLGLNEESLKKLRLEVQAAQEKRSEIEVVLAERRAELRYLEETARKELSVSLEELGQSEEAALDEAALEEAQSRYGQIRARIEALGPVNPQALEEYQEAQQRYDFLNTQRQDLLDSIRDTEKAIRDIDIETRRRFTHAFDAINTNFREMFRTLFGGGTGEMRLTDEANTAESGIEIVASPPGKRLQNVLLLSGGEKALTALSLLMAIFQYQPSPFCILDEVDAPLDEPNIQRLLRLIKEMSHQTQFVIITHAKTTMAAAETLYGVTMQEPGVSKLVSVKFHAVEHRQPQPEMSAVVV